MRVLCDEIMVEDRLAASFDRRFIGANDGLAHALDRGDITAGA